MLCRQTPLPAIQNRFRQLPAMQDLLRQRCLSVHGPLEPNRHSKHGAGSFAELFSNLKLQPRRLGAGAWHSTWHSTWRGTWPGPARCSAHNLASIKKYPLHVSAWQIQQRGLCKGSTTVGAALAHSAKIVLVASI